MESVREAHDKKSPKTVQEERGNKAELKRENILSLRSPKRQWPHAPQAILSSEEETKKESYTCSASPMSQRARGKERDFIYLILHHFQETWIFLCTDVKHSRTPPHTHTSSLWAVPPSTQSHAVFQALNTNVVSNLVLTPLNAHKQGLHPLPLTIWGPPTTPPAQLATGQKNPFTTLLQPHYLNTLQTPPL